MFDFSLYLASIDPGQHYEITKLTGGFVNVTVRATRGSPGAISSSIFQDHTLILKYAPPYVAGRGESFPMTQYRQVLEARALSVLQFVIPKEYDIQIPTVLKHDTKSHVLVISDLGNLPSLSEMFAELGGYTEYGGPPEFCTRKLGSSLEYCAYFSGLGSKLGRFFALLHSQQAMKHVESQLALTPKNTTNAELPQAWLDIATKPVRTQLLAFPNLLPISEAKTLYKELEQDCIRPLSDCEKSFVLGDCWTAAILVEPQITKPDPKIGVIDWEFAAIGRGLHGDIAQLLAHLELFRIAAVHQSKDDYVVQIDAITNSLMRSYASWSFTHDAAWMQQGDMYWVILRSSFLAQAAEMVNCAFWKVWNCDDVACVVKDGTHTKKEHDCVLIQKMVQRAIWYLRQAQRLSSNSIKGSADDELISAKIDTNAWGLLSLIDNEKYQ